MNDIKKRLNALLELRKNTEPGALIIGTQSGYMVFAFGAGEKFPEFTTEQEARDALTAHGITKICTIGCG